MAAAGGEYCELSLKRRDMAESGEAVTPSATGTTVVDAFPTHNLVGGVRLAMLIWAILLFGTLSVLTFRDQLGRLFGGG
jgi:hypothetical protein